jgi:hypothetical protein
MSVFYSVDVGGARDRFFDRGGPSLGDFLRFLAEGALGLAPEEGAFVGMAVCYAAKGTVFSST